MDVSIVIRTKNEGEFIDKTLAKVEEQDFSGSYEIIVVDSGSTDSTLNIIKDYDLRFAAWVRIEPRCRSNDFGRGVSARTADAPWMMARQWQVGEFMGDDAASPISVTLEHESQTLDSLRLGTSIREQSLGEGEGEVSGPLEMLVERERPTLDWRTRLQIGQRFEPAQ